MQDGVEDSVFNNAAGELRAYRGEIFHLLGDPLRIGAAALEHFADGLLVLREGRVCGLGPTDALLSQLPVECSVSDLRPCWILPGLVDVHTHYVQTDLVASHGEQLLDWLERYVYPAELAFVDPAHAREVAEFFCEELLRQGTTTAMVFASVHGPAVDALLSAAEARGMRLIAGKVLMDRNCPAALRDGADLGEAETRRLIERWEGRSRLGYAITPRFAPTSSPQQLALAGRLLADYPGVRLQSHLAENRAEGTWVKRLFPAQRSYLEVYGAYGLLGARSLYGHCLWLDAQDRQQLAQSDAAVAFCPGSNLFLGSGLFDLAALDACGLRVGLGSDIGAGTRFSMFATMAEAYKVTRLQGQPLSPERAFYLATLGGARCLGLEHCIGNLAPGKEADFLVIDPFATQLLERRMRAASLPGERLFALMMLADDRVVRSTYVLGRIR